MASASIIIPTHPVVALQDDLLRLVPVAILLGTLQIRTMVAIKVLENPVLILQATMCPLRRSILYCSQIPLLRSRCSRGGREA